jgi:hypothetical protein
MVMKGCILKSDYFTLTINTVWLPPNSFLNGITIHSIFCCSSLHYFLQYIQRIYGGIHGETNTIGNSRLSNRAIKHEAWSLKWKGSRCGIHGGLLGFLVDV